MKSPFCTVPGCGKKRDNSKSLCSMHRSRLKRHGDLNYVTNRKGIKRGAYKNRKCMVEGCGEVHASFGFCGKHYAKVRRLIKKQLPFLLSKI